MHYVFLCCCKTQYNTMYHKLYNSLFFYAHLLWTIRVVEVEMDPLRLAVQEYTPASDGDTPVSVRTLVNRAPVEVGGAGVRGTPGGPSHWKSGVSVTPLGRESEQVRVTVSPATTGDEGEDVSEIVAGSVKGALYRDKYTYFQYYFTLPIVWSSPTVTSPGRVLEMDIILTE